MNGLDEKLHKFFMRFPGIGRRQAKRFVYFMRSISDREVQDFFDEIVKVRAQTRLCQESYQFFDANHTDAVTSPLVRDPNRDNKVLMIVLKDADIEAMEKSGLYSGQYFVLGNLISLVNHDAPSSVRLPQLRELVQKRKSEHGLSEIIFALPVTAEGELTHQYLVEKLADITKDSIACSVLGRGLSTGLELEYSDSQTLKSALANRA